MPKITFIDSAGTAREVDAHVGDSVMETAINQDVPGIDADCGGACACATCHVYIADEWTDTVGKAEDLEADMLSIAEDVRDTSRLSCQIAITDDLDGLIVSTPETQC